jgi:predicted site-specific integrase-resolvase
MNRFSTIGKAAEEMGVSVMTLRRWEKEGRSVPVERTMGGHRRYDLAKIQPRKTVTQNLERATLAYARVSRHDQKSDLDRQKQMLEMYCSAQGWKFEICSDLGSGMNYHKRGLKRILTEIIGGRVGRLVLTHKDRLLRFGAELVFSICEVKGTEVVIINQGDEPSFEEELAQDVLEIITVFSARLYGSRSRKNKKLIESLQQAVEISHA